jgi:Tol biopolymer transport system component
MHRYGYLLLPFLLLIAPVQTEAQDVPENLTLKEIFHEPVIPGIRPQFRSFSTSMDSIYFSWNDSSYYETGLYKMALTGGEPEEIEEPPTRFVHSPNHQLMAWTQDGNIYIANADGSRERRIVATKENDINPVWSPNSRQVAFVRSGDVWVTDVHRPNLRQVTARDNDESGYSINAWAGNNRLVLSQSDFSGSRTVYFP